MTALTVSTARRLGATLLPDGKTHQNRLEIRSETSSRLYVVAQRKVTGAWECSCPGWISRRKCKHLTTMRPVLESSNG